MALCLHQFQVAPGEAPWRFSYCTATPPGPAEARYLPGYAMDNRTLGQTIRVRSGQVPYRRTRQESRIKAMRCTLPEIRDGLRLPFP